MHLVENRLKSFFDLTFLPLQALKTGLPLFAKIVIEEAKKGQINASLEEDELAFRVNQVSYTYFETFIQACQSGYLFDRESCEGDLRYAICHKCAIFTAELLNFDWLSEEELNGKFDLDAFEDWVVPQAVGELIEAYRSGNARAGYYLLWLIKKMSGAEFEIPARDSFRIGTAQWVLTRFIERKGECKAPHRLIETFPHELLLPAYRNAWLHYAMDLFHKMEGDDYPMPKAICSFVHQLVALEELTEEQLQGVARVMRNYDLNSTDQVQAFRKLTWKLYCLEEDDLTASFLFHWTLKYVGRAEFPLPKLDDCIDLDAITQYIEDEDVLPTPFITLLFLEIEQEEKLFCFAQAFLSQQELSIFFEKTFEQLKEVPMNEWSKRFTLPSFFKQVVENQRYQVAQNLASSGDPDTAEVGEHFAKALSAKSPGEAYTHIDALQKLIFISDIDSKEIFNKKYFSICSAPSLNAPSFMRHLSLSGECFVQGDIIIGTNSANDLVAYDLRKERMLWSIPVSHPIKQLRFFDQYIAIHIHNSDSVSIMELATGKKVGSIFTGRFAPIMQFLSGGLMYQYFQGGVDIGKVENGNLRFIKRVKVLPCSFPGQNQFGTTHFIQQRYRDYEWDLDFISPSGYTKVLKKSSVAIPYGNKVVVAEKNKVTLRALTDNEQVFSEPEAVFPLEGEVEEGEVYGNTVLLLQRAGTSLTPVYIDLKTGQITKSSHTFNTYDSWALHSETGVLYVMRKSEKNLNKFYPTGAMEEIKVHDSVNCLRHVGRNGTLYYS